MSALPSPQARDDTGAALDVDAPVALAGIAAPALAPGLTEAVETWRVRMAGAGIACRAVALHGANPEFQLGFSPDLGDLAERWALLRTQIGEDNAVALSRPDSAPGADLLMVTSLQLPDGQMGVVGVAVAPPLNERTIQLVLLALGWLQLALAAPRLARSQRALTLLDLLGHVASQARARSAAQEWVNRTAAWARQEAPEAGHAFSLMLFEVRAAQPRWWVTADTAWAEKASPEMQNATELATQAVVEQQDIQTGSLLALPVIDGGEVWAVLVLQMGGNAAMLPTVPPALVGVLRGSLDLAEPLLRRWREAERPLWRHALDSLRGVWRKLREPGHLSWKAGAAGVGLMLVVLLAVPVPDRVTANVVIEGQQRQVLSAPFEAFIAQVLVRPGERVRQGQLLAVLDDRELKLEQARFRSEQEQAAGRLRQAMTDHESAAQALALAEVQQAQAQLSLTEAKLARTGLVAPADGLVVSGDWVQQIGSPVETGKELFEIAVGQGYRVVLHVPDRDITRVQIGQTGALRLTGQPQAVHEFKIANLTATASVQDSINGFRVEASWVGEVPALSPGMQGVGKIEVGRANLLTVWTRHSIDWLRLKLWTWWW